MSSTPFDDFRALLHQGEGPNDQQRAAMIADLGAKSLPEESASVAVLSTLAAWQKAVPVVAREVHLCLFAASYDAATPVDALKAFMAATRQGAAPVNILAQDHGLGLRVLDLAVDHPHKPFTWQEKDCAAAMAFGMEALAAGGDILGLGDTGFGNEAYALALACAVLRLRGDIDTLLFSPAKPVHNQAAALLAGVPDGADPFLALQLVGGPDIAAGVGALMGARALGMPVLIEGTAMLAAAALLFVLQETALDHVLLAASRCEADRELAKMLGLSPILGTDPGAAPGAALAQAHRVIAGMVSLQGLRAKKPSAGPH